MNVPLTLRFGSTADLDWILDRAVAALLEVWVMNAQEADELVAAVRVIRATMISHSVEQEDGTFKGTEEGLIALRAKLNELGLTDAVVKLHEEGQYEVRFG